MNKKDKLLLGIVGIFVGLWVLIGVEKQAMAHTGSPSMVTWSSGQALTHTDLNNALAHLHNTLSGGIVDANINTTAAIAHTKFQYPGLLPKAQAICGDCATSPCTCIGTRITSANVTRDGTGDYNVTLDYTPTDDNYAVLITPLDTAVFTFCSAKTIQSTTPHIEFTCRDGAGPTVQDVGFSILVMDDN